MPTLNIVLDDKGGNGIVCYLANCYIENCNLVINGGTEGIYFKAGGKGDGGLFINNADVRIEAMESAMSGVFDLVLGKDLEILSPEGATFQPAGEKAFENIFADEMVSPSVHIGTPSGVVILPFTREIVIGFPTDDFTTDGKTPVDLYNTVIDNVFYVVDNNNETDNSGYYDTEEQCVVLNQTTTTEQMETVVQFFRELHRPHSSSAGRARLCRCEHADHRRKLRGRASGQRRSYLPAASRQGRRPRGLRRGERHLHLHLRVRHRRDTHA